MAIPWLEGKCIENCPQIYGIATLVLQSAADLVMAMIAGGNHTLIGCAHHPAMTAALADTFGESLEEWLWARE